MFFIIKTVFSLKGVQLKRLYMFLHNKNQHLRSDVDFLIYPLIPLYFI